MYCDRDFMTKSALKAAVKAGERVSVWQPGPYPQRPGTAPRDGVAYVEGPHYPRPHRWYAAVLLRDGAIVNVR